MKMEQIFEKESIMIEWVPYSIMAFFSMMFLIFSITSKTVFMAIASLLFSIFLAFFPVMTFLYLKSFISLRVFNNKIEIIKKNGSAIFSIPKDLRRVKIDADDLQIELKNSGQRFVLRSHFLKNKTDFHKLFDQIIKDHPPAEDRVILKASVLEMMEKSKNN